MNRGHDDGTLVLEFAQGLDLPPESMAPFLEATAELANLADTRTATPEPGTWLRLAKHAAELIGAEEIPPLRDRRRSRRSRGRGGLPWLR